MPAGELSRDMLRVRNHNALMESLLNKKFGDNSRIRYSPGVTLTLLAVIVIVLGLLLAIPLPSTAKSVKYSDVIRFLNKDDTYRIPFQPGEFVCWDFAKRLQKDVIGSGIRCSVVTLAWGDSDRSHVINAFATTDKGLI
jgi:hypothetical protein